MATDEQRALWAAIRANPDDDTPRLVYADWLQEHGDEPRAEFIRLQIEQNALFSPSARCSDPNERTLTRRESKLLSSHREQWLRPISETVEATASRFNWAFAQREIKFARGFAYNVPLPLRAVCALTTPEEEIEPLEDVIICKGIFGAESPAALMAEVAAWRHAGSIREIGEYSATDDFVRAMVSGRLNRLQEIDFCMGSVSDEGATLLAGWQQASSLRVLDLRENQITDTGARALAESSYLDGLAKLYLAWNQFTAVGRSLLRERFGTKLHIESEP